MIDQEHIPITNTFTLVFPMCEDKIQIHIANFIVFVYMSFGSFDVELLLKKTILVTNIQWPLIFTTA